MSANRDTIIAIATPPGRGGIGIVRVSGPQVRDLCITLFNHPLEPRLASFHTFKNENGESIDQGLALFFAAPHSFTGEDVLELHAHGSPVVLDQLLKMLIHYGARLARPGEFSERAFLNDKIDLVQAEAIADLISSATEQAARAALHSLQGDFSKRITAIVDALIELRVFIEVTLDFSEEEIDFLTEGDVLARIEHLISDLDVLLAQAHQGQILRDGLSLVLIGRPNAGKSSLMNQLIGHERAIVTDIPGTTRDVLREPIEIDGIPIHLVDTAGLRDSTDPIEQEGIKRTLLEIEKSDCIVVMFDAKEPVIQDFRLFWAHLFPNLPQPHANRLIFVRNKIDLLNESSSFEATHDIPLISLSAKTGQGLELLKNHIKKVAGFSGDAQGGFSARRRHLEALEHALVALRHSLDQQHAPELMAEHLKHAQTALSSITGEFTTDDLLGKIFSSFCIGK